MRPIRIFLTLTFLFLTFTSSPSIAGHHGQAKAWTLLPSQSSVAYGSIKKDVVGEVNHFKEFKGSIDNSGKASIHIDLSSVETYIDIRNQRMIKHVFGNAPTANLTAQLDLGALSNLSAGATTLMDVTGKLSFLDKELEIDTTFFVAKLSKDKILATTNNMIMVKTESLGINSGIDKLMEIAKLPGITRVAPVTLRLVFDKHGDHHASSKSSTKPLAANTIKAGKKLFAQCQACHNTKDKVNAVGPHLVGIMGRKAGSIASFNYSPALANANMVWSRDKLAQFITNPKKAVPGNTMPYNGMSNPQDVDNLMDYLGTL